jgi:hypothetical protein
MWGIDARAVALCVTEWVQGDVWGGAINVTWNAHILPGPPLLPTPVAHRQQVLSP